MKILAMDLGKFESVSCEFNVEKSASLFATIPSDRRVLEIPPQRSPPDLVVIEACTLAGWVVDLCQQLGFKILAAGPAAEALCWKNVKRKIGPGWFRIVGWRGAAGLGRSVWFGSVPVPAFSFEFANRAGCELAKRRRYEVVLLAFDLK